MLQLTVSRNVSLEGSVGGVILEHVDHVVQRDEGIVNGNHIHAFVQGSSQDQTADATESVNSDLSHFYGLKSLTGMGLKINADI